MTGRGYVRALDLYAWSVRLREADDGESAEVFDGHFRQDARAALVEAMRTGKPVEFTTWGGSITSATVLP